MYYEEKWIDGKLCYRHTPDGEWTEFDINSYRVRCYELQQQVNSVDLAEVGGSLPDDSEIFAAACHHRDTESRNAFDDTSAFKAGVNWLIKRICHFKDNSKQSKGID